MSAPEFSDWWATVGSRLPHITPEDVARAAWLAAGGGSARGRDTLPLPPDRAGVDIMAALALMTASERETIFRKISEEHCLHCGGYAGCQCWNDE